MAKTGQVMQVTDNRRVDAFGGWVYLAPAVRDFMNVLFFSAETLLRVLNNDRLTSKINAENFDVDVKHKIGVR